MGRKLQIPQRVTAILVYGRPPLVFGGMLCAIGVMWTRNPVLYMMGVILLFISMSFDLVDGWFSARFRPDSTFAHLADRIMDKIVYSIIFPLIAFGAMWSLPETPAPIEMLHAIFILFLCITVLIRDNFAQFMRNFAIRKGQEPEPTEFTRLRTIVAAPVGALLYAYAFYIPNGPPSQIYTQISWVGNLPLRGLFFIEIIFLIINFGSIAAYCRKYGTYCLDELCLGDEKLRRRILSFFPNALTVMNAFMGLLAVFFAYQGRIREAYLLLIGAAMFDKLDGAVARKLGLTEPLPGTESSHNISLGGILDDISDAVSFCIVPAWIFYITLGNCLNPMVIVFVAVLYAGLGICRLIYFTLDTTPIPGFFKGLPTPGAAMLVSSPLIMFSQATPEWVQFWGIFCLVTMIVASVLMNFYPIRYLHLGRFMSRKPWFARMSGLLVIIFVFSPFFGHVAFLYMFLYLLSPLVTGRIDPAVAAKETRVD
ncbi:MAG: CDP-alcohol phosphatidyltransferase [Desulfobacterales bacterium]|nr:CDP-alcohol phosphatidyltransferase [Desulfobacterales bacterium]